MRYSANGITHWECRDKTHIDRYICTWKYDGVIKKAILALKYRFVYTMAEELGKFAVDPTVARQLINTVLVPIPLHKNRLKWRGFNQSAELANILSKKYATPIENNLLKRTTNNPQQAMLPKAERVRNTCGIFAVNTKMLPKYKHKTIVLVDDVATTGSTLNEAARVLKEAGVKQVWGLVLAE